MFRLHTSKLQTQRQTETDTLRYEGEMMQSKKVDAVPLIVVTELFVLVAFGFFLDFAINGQLTSLTSWLIIPWMAICFATQYILYELWDG